METACEFVLLSLKQLETVLSKIYMEMIQSMLASIIPLAMLISGLTEVQCKFFAAFAPDRRSSDCERIIRFGHPDQPHNSNVYRQAKHLPFNLQEIIRTLRTEPVVQIDSE